MRVVLIASMILGVLNAPASAQYSGLRPSGAVPALDGCNEFAGYPDCHPDRPYMYQGRSVAMPRPPAPPNYPAHGR